jgi:hypothetical protein
MKHIDLCSKCIEDMIVFMTDHECIQDDINRWRGKMHAAFKKGFCPCSICTYWGGATDYFAEGGGEELIGHPGCVYSVEHAVIGGIKR